MTEKRKTPIMRKCRKCGTKFTSYTVRKLFCSKQCGCLHRDQVLRSLGYEKRKIGSRTFWLIKVKRME